MLGSLRTDAMQPKVNSVLDEYDRSSRQTQSTLYLKSLQLNLLCGVCGRAGHKNSAPKHHSLLTQQSDLVFRLQKIIHENETPESFGRLNLLDHCLLCRSHFRCCPNTILEQLPVCGRGPTLDDFCVGRDIIAC